VTADARTGVRVRDAREEDLDQIHAIEVASFADPWSRDGFRELLSHSHARMSVAAGRASEVLGYSVTWFVSDESEIANLAVGPAARRGGVGALLLDTILAEATRAGARAVFLEVRESNEAARTLYASREFMVVGRRKEYYRRPVEDALVMRRTIERG
jgi:ribosomal-protein-alanine N-acetyltransferase